MSRRRMHIRRRRQRSIWSFHWGAYGGGRNRGRRTMKAKTFRRFSRI